MSCQCYLVPGWRGPAVSSPLIALTTVLVSACWTAPRALVTVGPISPRILVSGLSPCALEDDTDLVLDPQKPTTLLVHGCNFSAGGFRTLAAVFEAHGHQTACFNYNDRARLEESSAQLIAALEVLEEHLEAQEITILGHSQGGLVARRALVAERAGALRPNPGFQYRLVTISSPFAGILAASHCGFTWLHALTLGTSMGICQAVAGSKWWEIFPGSEFMLRPGTLAPEVGSYVKIVTNEQGTCRQMLDDGNCGQGDEIFTVPEQYNPTIDLDPRTKGIEVKAGHVEIVGELGTPPTKLIQILQDQQILARTPAEKMKDMVALLRRLYHCERCAPL